MPLRAPASVAMSLTVRAPRDVKPAKKPKVVFIDRPYERRSEPSVGPWILATAVVTSVLVLALLHAMTTPASPCLAATTMASRVCAQHDDAPTNTACAAMVALSHAECGLPSAADLAPSNRPSTTVQHEGDRRIIVA